MRRANRFLPIIAKPEGVIGTTIPFRSRSGKINSSQRDAAVCTYIAVRYNEQP